jgi:hypothetical protein
MPPTLTRHEMDTLDRFQDVMLAKLNENAHKGGWKAIHPRELLLRARWELDELERAITTWEKCKTPVSKAFQGDAVAREAADVANYCVFIADVCGGLK